jgi:DNA-binding GntR family transcriptional regulator
LETSSSTKVGERHPTLRALACDQIRTWIVTGRLAPGSRLVENVLAEELGVSRIPVREALKQLQTEGFVDIAPRRGAVVAEVSMKEAEDFYEVRSALESFAARKAAQCHKPADLDRLQRIVEDGRKALRMEAWPELTRLNSAFHEAIAAATGNDHLVELMAAYGLKLAWIFSASAQRRGAAAWTEHEEIIAAIADGDAELAEVLAARHIVRSQREFTAGRP